MYPEAEAAAVLNLSAAWFERRPDVLGLVLVGSYARGTAGPESDLDLVILTRTTAQYRADVAWPQALPWGSLGLAVRHWRDQDYGVLWSRHVTLTSQLEVEYGFASPAWAALDPPDAGTRQVMMAGHRILYDPDQLLRRLAEALTA